MSAEDKEAFLRFIPGSRPVLFLYATLLATVGVCYLPGQFVYDLSHALVLLLTISTLAVDMRFNYWTKQRGLDYWNQVRLVGDNATVITGTILLLSSSKKKPVTEEKID